MTNVPVLALRHLDPAHREHLSLQQGISIAEIVAAALPGLSEGLRAFVRVLIGEDAIPQAAWARVRPKAGTLVVVRLVPEGETLRPILSIVVSIAAIALGQFWLGPLLAGSEFAAAVGLSGNAANAIAAAGAVGVSQMLFNAFVPARPGIESVKDSPTYSIQGLQNAANPNGVCPNILGFHRVAPLHAAIPYTQIVGQQQFITALFTFGEGPVTLSDLRLGEIALANYGGVTTEIREGYPTDTPVTLYPQQVIEDKVGARLDQSGVVRVTARDITEVEIDLIWPQGLAGHTSAGVVTGLTVDVTVRQRLLGAVIWDTVTTISTGGFQQTPVFNTYRWTLPARGQYEIHLFRTTPELNDGRFIDRVDWATIRGYRPEYPLNFDKPLALVAIHMRATDQLNGMIDNFNALAQRVALDWDTGTQTWIARETQNPASLFRYALQNCAAYPRTVEQIDLAGLEDWAEYCEDNGLKYNRVHDYNASWLDVLADIAAAGRASPHDDGIKWGVVIDRPRTQVIGHITPRNSWGFSGDGTYTRFPDAFRVQFLDETNGYNSAERIVPWPGLVGDPEITEDLPLPGFTDPALVWIEARRRQYELIHRVERYTVNQSVDSLVLTRGDLNVLNHDVLDRSQIAGRVKSIGAGLVTLDTLVTMESSGSYACRFRLSGGTSLLVGVVLVPGDTDTLIIGADISALEVGNLALFGRLSEESFETIVQNVEANDDLTVRLTLVDHAPQIEALIAAEVPPVWDGRVGEVV